MPITNRVVACVRCGREFVTEQVQVLRFEFRGQRFCPVCREAEHAEEPQRRAEILWTQASIPREYATCSFDTFVHREGTQHALALAKRWIADLRHGIRPRRGLLFHGPTGAGKTHLAVALVREAIYSPRSHDRPFHCLFLNVPEWLNGIRMAWDSTDNPEPPNPDGYELVVIDDLGAENATNWSKERIYSLINHREQQGLLTIVTTNLALGELDGRLGRPTASRLVKLCADVPLNPVSDYRVVSAASG
jgi:DNA replication protein DnaC